MSKSVLQDKKLRTHLVELLVVFAGLFLAFTLDRAWDSYKTSKAEENYLNGFYQDIKVDLLDLESTSIEIVDRKANLKAILDTFTKVEMPKDSVVSAMKLMLHQSLFIPQKITYESLTNSGSLNIISNFELRQSIINLYMKYGGLSFTENVFNKYSEETVFPYCQKNYDFYSDRSVNNNIHKDVFSKYDSLLFFIYKF